MKELKVKEPKVKESKVKEPKVPKINKKFNIKITPQDVVSGNKNIIKIKLLLQEIYKFLKKKIN